MGMDRYLRESIYHLRRKKNLKQQKRGTGPTFSVINMNKGIGLPRDVRQSLSIKKLVGVGLMVIALLLLLSQCFFKGNSKAKNNGPTTTTVSEQVTPAEGRDVSPEGTISAFSMEDFPMDPVLTPRLLKLSNRYHNAFSDSMAIWWMSYSKGLSKGEIIQSVKKDELYLGTSEQEAFLKFSTLYEQFIYDIESFPLSGDYPYNYENSWKDARNYKTSRQHLGTDLLSSQAPSGVIPIRSITAGVVENVGWNELGGYRVGIRSNGGAYFYYAHLDELPTQIQKGDRVNAGEQIGLMGDTGYGPEGTRGKFPVHLHVGIALTDENKKEFWINPYPILQYLENAKG